MQHVSRALRATLLAAVLLVCQSVSWAGALDGIAKLGFGTDPAAALSQAEASHRPVFLFFTTDW